MEMRNPGGSGPGVLSGSRPGRQARVDQGEATMEAIAPMSAVPRSTPTGGHSDPPPLRVVNPGNADDWPELNEAVDDPCRLARLFLDQWYPDHGPREAALKHWCGEWYEWRRSSVLSSHP